MELRDDIAKAAVFIVAAALIILGAYWPGAILILACAGLHVSEKYLSLPEVDLKDIWDAIREQDELINKVADTAEQAKEQATKLALAKGLGKI